MGQLWMLLGRLLLWPQPPWIKSIDTSAIIFCCGKGSHRVFQGWEMVADGASCSWWRSWQKKSASWKLCVRAPENTRSVVRELEATRQLTHQPCHQLQYGRRRMQRAQRALSAAWLRARLAGSRIRSKDCSIIGPPVFLTVRLSEPGDCSCQRFLRFNFTFKLFNDELIDRLVRL